MRHVSSVILTSFVILAGISPAVAEDQPAVISYAADYFAGAQLATAYDMVSRLPGFVFDDGASARGFAGTAGNVVIDGARPTAKTDDLQAILQRIPADRVLRIDLVRGSAPGIDMQGQSVIANVVLKREDSTSTVVKLSNILYADHTDAPGGSLEFSRRDADRVYDATLTRIKDIYDDSAGNGAYRFTTPGGASDTGSVRRRGTLRLGWGLNATTSQPLWGGTFDANITAQLLSFHNSLAYGAPDAAQFAETKKVRPTELGLHWNASFGAHEITLLALERLEQDKTADMAGSVTGSQLFVASSHTGESILRGTWRYRWSDALTLESGAEGAYNTLNGRSSLLSNNAAVALPAAIARVNERRGEIFAQASWTFAANGTVEAATRAEFSRLSALGVPSRSFAYAKPRLLVSWSPWQDNQIRLRAERVVGQLDFSNFVASANFSGVGVSAGNLNLRPDQRWQYEGDYELHFWGKGALVASAMHEDISDLVDFVPIGGGLDGPGNIRKASNDEFKLNLTVPVDVIGAGGLFKATMKWDDGALTDPLTGQTRTISGQRDRDIGFDYRQDVPAWRSTFDLFLNPGGWSRPSYRISQVSTSRLLTPYFQASWEYKPAPDLDLTVEVDNVIPYHLAIVQDYYAGPRNGAALTQHQDIRNNTEPRLFLQLRKTI